jgi:hypothetical protein
MGGEEPDLARADFTAKSGAVWGEFDENLITKNRYVK